LTLTMGICMPILRPRILLEPYYWGTLFYSSGISSSIILYKIVTLPIKIPMISLNKRIQKYINVDETNTYSEYDSIGDFS
jgi:hypothetical protein